VDTNDDFYFVGTPQEPTRQKQKPEVAETTDETSDGRKLESLHMNHLLIVTTCLSLLSGAAVSQETPNVFKNPCERGPAPTWKIINNSRSEFVTFLQTVRPTMPLDVAENIAYSLCDDLKLLNDDEALTRRLSLLLTENGY
jgi:hypothetical protein